MNIFTVKTDSLDELSCITNEIRKKICEVNNVNSELDLPFGIDERNPANLAIKLPLVNIEILIEKNFSPGVSWNDFDEDNFIPHSDNRIYGCIQMEKSNGQNVVEKFDAISKYFCVILPIAMEIINNYSSLCY